LILKKKYQYLKTSVKILRINWHTNFLDDIHTIKLKNKNIILYLNMRKLKAIGYKRVKNGNGYFLKYFLFINTLK